MEKIELTIANEIVKVFVEICEDQHNDDVLLQGKSILPSKFWGNWIRIKVNNNKEEIVFVDSEGNHYA